MIFLSISSGISDIYLLREHSEFNSNNSNNSNDDIKEINQEFRIVIIYELCRSILDIYKRMINIDIQVEKRYINDFIFICYLLGNDFLPHLPGLSIKQDGMNIIIESY